MVKILLILAAGLSLAARSSSDDPRFGRDGRLALPEELSRMDLPQFRVGNDVRTRGGRGPCQPQIRKCFRKSVLLAGFYGFR